MRQTVTIDEKMLKRVEKQLGDLSSKAPQAISRALNRAVSSIATNISKSVRAEYNIKAAEVKGTIEKKNSTRTRLNAIVKSRGELLPLDRFKVSPRKVSPKRKAPIKVAVKKGGLKTLPGAFVGDISGVKVFKRAGKERLPINRLFGPSVPQMLGNEEIREKINQEGNEVFHRRLDHEINRILERGAGQ